MGKLVVTSFVSLDGVMQAPGGPDEDRSGGFAHGGWIIGLGDEGFGQTMVDIFSRPAAFLLGRGTFDIFEGYWPKQTSANHPIASKLNALPKYVVSKTRTSSDWKPTTFLGDIDAVRTLKTKIDGELQVHGSPRLSEALFAAKLVDEWHMVQAPVILGSGKKLFEGKGTAQAMKITRTVTTPNGITIRTYVPNGDVVQGDATKM
ncbi:MAG TPA: dihydrofolate reductase family protein [Polyangiaceae bacterium]